MSITPVATVLDTLVLNPATIYLRASYSTSMIVPSAVAVGDILVLAGTIQSSSFGHDPMVAAGWTAAVTPAYSTSYTNCGQPDYPTSYAVNLATGIWWKRWTGSGVTTFPGMSSRLSPGDIPPIALTIWRGVQGFRDLSTLVGSATSAPIQWPGAAGGVGDIAVLAATYSGATAAITSTTPATTVTARARGPEGVAANRVTLAATGTTPSYLGNASGTFAQLLTATLCLAIAPLMPTLGSPVPSAIDDLAAGPTFTWAHNRAGYAGSASGAQESYALRRRVGVAAYEYWNAGTAAWDGSIVWNSSVVQGVTFPTAAWTNETVYGWSVATTEDAGHNAGPFAPDRVLTARTKPVVSLTAPTAVVTTPQPPIVWSTSFTSPWAPIAYEVKIFEAAIAALTGFDPDVVSPVWTSGAYASTATTVTPWVGLSNAIEYRVFVRVQQTGAQWSDWTYVDFLVSLAAPATPALTATAGTDPVTGCPLIQVTTYARDNLLTAADASFEAGVGSWVGDANTTLATTTSWAADGAQALQLTATAAGDVSAAVDHTTQLVSPGEVLTATAVFGASAVARAVGVTLQWHDAAGASLGSTPSVPVSDSTTAPTTVAVIVAAPAGAATVALSVTAAALGAAETLYVDEAGIAPGSGTPWSPGGYTDVTVLVEFSDDPIGGTWGVIASGVTLGRSVTVTDWCAQPGQMRCYRARTAAGIYTSAPSEVAVAVIDVTEFWLVDAAAGVGIRLDVTDDDDRTRSVDRGVFEALGRPARIAVTGTVRNQAGGMIARADSEAGTDALADLLATGRVLLRQQPPEAGVYPRHLFTVVTSDVKVARLTHGAFPWRALSWSWTEDDAPVGEAPGAVLPSLGVGIWL